MDDWDLRPRHNRNPPFGERVLGSALMLFSVLIGSLSLAGLVDSVFNALSSLIR